MVEGTAVFVQYLTSGQNRVEMLLLCGVNINESVTVYIWLVPEMFSLCYAFLI